jgi:hypothetical protein
VGEIEVVVMADGPDDAIGMYWTIAAPRAMKRFADSN